MAFCTPTATPTPHTSSWKHVAFCNPSRLTAGAGGGQRGARLAGASLEVRALAPATAADAAAAAAPSSPNVDYLAAEFAGHGVSFEAVGGSCAVKMEVRNGSAAHLLLPGGLVTSYKPAMWHGAPTEVLHTTVAEGPGGRAVIRGGVSMDLRCGAGDGGQPPWSPGGSWSLRDVRGSPTGFIEVELASAAPAEEGCGCGGVEARCVVTLHPEALAAELTVRNSAAAGVALSAAVSTHLRVSTPDATYAVGLQGSDYRTMDPARTEFTIVPPEFMSRSPPPAAATTFPHRWATEGFDAVLAGRLGAAAQEPDGEEDDDYKQMTAEMCRIYSHAPRQFTIIDRGRRNSICVQRRGFEEVYVLSPGSKHQWYGRYAYVCVGPTMLEPILLGPGATWSGAQYLHNPNF
ncbi:protein NDH-DEPENDENT CYCLIC ELECTRON FLOW 5 [Oryza brachyantha]|nr:protein NDH-DEPENDENT CYCLIC ELECTRON FLOW 5 [Oryza brachyantha]